MLSFRKNYWGFFRDGKIEFFEIKSVDGNILSKLVNLVYLLDYASVYHAVLNKIDPSPVNAIDFVKNKLWGFTDELCVKFYI